MNNVEQAAGIIKERHRNDQLEGDGVVGCFDAAAAAQALADAGLLAPAPQIIRTLDELEALDPETLCVTSAFGNVFPAMVLHKRPEHAMPAAVIATGAQVRAARTALQEATE